MSSILFNTVASVLISWFRSLYRVWLYWIYTPREGLLKTLRDKARRKREVGESRDWYPRSQRNRFENKVINRIRCNTKDSYMRPKIVFIGFGNIAVSGGLCQSCFGTMVGAEDRLQWVCWGENWSDKMDSECGGTPHLWAWRERSSVDVDWKDTDVVLAWFLPRLHKLMSWVYLSRVRMMALNGDKCSGHSWGE